MERIAEIVCTSFFVAMATTSFLYACGSPFLLPRKVLFLLISEKMRAILCWIWALFCGLGFHPQDALFLWQTQRKMSLQV